ncbi:SMI1/KNR4 family protein [Kitasatospora sp. NPDC096140]|uniref:SMI1/KNR4 family protein n=1 Tax=unclassified Kitasatospora TaxID=2633591 RepID=UPI00331F77A6
MQTLHAFTTWEPLLTLLRAEHADRLAGGTGHVAGSISPTGWSLSLPLTDRLPPRGEPMVFPDRQPVTRAVAPLQRALAEAGVREVMFGADISPDGRTVLHLFGTSPAVASAFGSPSPGTLLLVDDAVAEPWRRPPAPASGAVPAPSADPGLLERTLRERLPDAVGATEEEIAAAEVRLGVTLPEELKALYRATRVRPAGPDGSGDWEADFAEQQAAEAAVGCELSPLEWLFTADADTRPCPWQYAATEAVATPPDAAVQDLVGSPGWIGFGSNGGDTFAVDLTPGPRGHLGQVILIDHEQHIGAELYGESLTELVLNGFERCAPRGRDRQRLPVTARVGDHHELSDLTSAAHPALEVVEIFRHGGAPLSLAPVAGLPRLRTLTAHPGTLADPLEVTGLGELEYLGLGVEEWRALLDAGAVPPTLLAACVEVRGDEHPSTVVDMANELLALRGRPLIPRTTVHGRLRLADPSGR